jgi:hypothetical protein
MGKIKEYGQMVRTIRRAGAEAQVNLAQKRSWFADSTQTAANVVFSANARKYQGILGETGVVGQPVYKSSTDNRLYLADANASPATADCVGLLCTGGAAGQDCTFSDWDPDFTPGITMSLSAAADSALYVLSGTAGKIAPMDDLANGMYPVVLFVAKSTTKATLAILKQSPITATITA